jgi:pimeloyl-ACP methyl ester carboxylesterase
VKQQYREVWETSLTGGCNYYRASPLRPPRPRRPGRRRRSRCRATCSPWTCPTFVLWAMDDVALPPELIDGLEEYIADLTLEKVAGATHWIVHERPAFVAQRGWRAFLARR